MIVSAEDKMYVCNININKNIEKLLHFWFDL